MVCKPDYTILEINPAFARISGCVREEWIHKTIRDFTCIKREGSDIDVTISGRESVSGYITYNFPSGIRHLSYSFILVSDKDGQVIKIFAVFSDITGISEQIHESKTLIAENLASIVTSDLNENFLSVNKSFLELTQMPEEKLLTMNMKDFTLISRDGATLSEVLESKNPGKGIMTVDFGNRIRVVEYTYIPVLDASGSARKIVTMYLDITEQKTYINEINTFISENPYVIFTLDLDLNVTSANPEFFSLSGYTPEMTRNLKLRDFKILKREGETVDIAIKTGKPAKGSIIVEFSTGIKHMDNIYIPVKDPKGNVYKLYEIFADRTAMVDQLHESERLIAENPASIVTSDLQGNFHSVNKAFLDLTRMSEDRLLSMNIRDFTIISREGSTFAEILSSGQTGKGEMTVDFGDRIRVLEYTYIPVLDASGSMKKIVTMYLDITEQKTYINEITSFLSESPYAIFTLGLDLQITDANPEFSRMSGYSHEELTNRKISDFKVLQRSGEGVDVAIQTGKSAIGTIIVDFPAGIRHMRYIYIPIKDPRGRVYKLYEIFADQTAMVDQLHESTTLIDENPSSIIFTDLQGNLISFNKAFLDLTRFSDSKLRTMSIKDFNIIAREGSSFSEVLVSKSPGKGNMTVDFGNRIKDLEYTYIPILDVNNNIAKLVMMYTDVTTIKKMVRYLEQSIQNLYKNISDLSQGETNFKTTVLEADEEIAKAREQFTKITRAVEIARESISRLVQDSTTIASAAVAGNLSFRIDPKTHEGDFRQVIDGMNQTLISIETPVREAMQVSKAYAGYDFTSRFNKNLDIKGDWISFKEALDEIGDKISQAIQTINDQVHTLSINVQEANVNVKEITEGASQMAKIATNVSSNADEGNSGIQQILKAMEDLTVTVGDVSKKAEDVSILTRNSNDLAKEGSNLAKKAEEGMQVITGSADDIYRLIHEIQQEMGKIGKIVSLISDIASQTNLLALNAAIEAARAGEAGRGFAVVASEVKSLATESRTSAENISEMINSLQKKTEDAGKSAAMASEAVKEGNTAMTETLAVFGKLAASVEDIAINIEQVASMSEEQAASVEEITASVNEVSTVLERNTKEAVEIAGISEESAASLDELSKVIDHVNNGTKEVSGAVSSFVV